MKLKQLEIVKFAQIGRGGRNLGRKLMMMLMMIEQIKCTNTNFYFLQHRSNIVMHTHRHGIQDGGSVTRQLDYFFNIGPFATMKICPTAQEILPKYVIILPNTKQTLYQLPKSFKTLSKGRYFAESGHTGWRQSGTECFQWRVKCYNCGSL